MKQDKDALKDARARFKDAMDGWSQVRDDALEDIKFARLAEQWPQEVATAREREGRPCLTVNRMPSFIRQVVNDARQNKPSIRVRPVDNYADPETADVMNGLFRHIESTSDADVAYDTAIDCAVSGGFGFFRIDVDYAHDDTFDMDILLRAIGNQFSVHFDPKTTAADSSDWRYAFIVEEMDRKEFERMYPGAHAGEFVDDDKVNPWFTENSVRIAEYFDRYEVQREVLLLSDGDIVDAEVYKNAKDNYEALGVTVQNSRTIVSHKVKHCLMTGAEKLEETDWAGKYIPIVPVYGEEVNVEGKRYFRSLIRDSKDPQRMYNYWRTSATELVALAPKAPWIAKEGTLVDPEKWESSNTETFAYLEYEGDVAPQRQNFDASPVGAMQQALSSSDDMKDIMGLYDASLGQRSNETSGRAIMARQREGDTSTFHFIDNLTRAIRCGGRIVLDLIPRVYNTERIIRILGEDDTPQTVKIGQVPEGMEQMPDYTDVFDLTKGKYDLVVTAGPSFTTRREEAVTQMTELGRAYPQLMQVAGDIMAKNLDWPGADEIAERLRMLMQQQFGPKEEGPDPEVVKMEQKTQAEIQGMQAKAQADIEISRQKALADAQTKREVALFEAETDRMVELGEAAAPKVTVVDARPQ